ncbi:hypothetical protein [Lentibacillus persicus]|uniref:hypothetical protein n=1 Tax=Lentibacillus persicus TaxID=640948 RepID=UPI001C433045|nr:hypothetical protein [Lentibacillus persicus]
MLVTKALQQDKESCNKDASHEEKVVFFFEDVAFLAFVPLNSVGKVHPLIEVSLYPASNWQ